MAVGETPSLTEEFIGETHRVLECTQTHPPGNQHQKGLIVAGKVTKSPPRAKQVALFLSDPSPTYSTTTGQGGLPLPGEYLRLHLLELNRHDETKKIWRE